LSNWLTKSVFLVYNIIVKNKCQKNRNNGKDFRNFVNLTLQEVIK